MCKKVSVLFLAMLLVFSAIPAGAVQMEKTSDDTLVYDSVTYALDEVFFDDFEGYTEAGTPDGYIIGQNMSCTPEEDTYGTCVQCAPMMTDPENEEEPKTKDMEFYKQLSGGLFTGTKYYATVKVKFSSTNKSGRILSAKQNDPKLDWDLFQVAGTGYLQTISGENLMPYAADTWYQVDMVFDTAAHVASVVVNGNTIIDKQPISEELSVMNRLDAFKRFACPPEETVLVDDFGLYELKDSLATYENKYDMVVNENLSTDFNDGELGYSINAGGTITTETTDAEHELSAKIAGGGSGGLFKDTTLTGNLLLLSEEVKFSTTTQSRQIFAPKQNKDDNLGLEEIEIRYLEATNNGWFAFGTDSTSYRNTTIMQYVADVWYKIDLLVDLEGQTYQYFIDGTAATPKMALPGKIEKFNRIMLCNQWSAPEGSDMYVDNVEISTLTPKYEYEMPGYNAQMLEELEKSYEVTTVMYEGFEDTTWDANVKATNPVLTDGEGGNLEQKAEEFGKSLKLTVGEEGQEAPELRFQLNEKLTTGKAIVTASYWFGDAQHQRIMVLTDQSSSAGGKAEEFVIGFDNDATVVQGREFNDSSAVLSRYNGGAWYDVMAVIDLDVGTYDVYLNGTKLISGREFVEGFTGLDRIDIAKLWNQTNPPLCDSYFDNVGVYTLEERTETPMPQLGITRYSKPVTAMSDLQKGDVIHCQAPAGLEGEMVIALYQGGKLVKVSVGNSLTLPRADLTGYSVKAMLFDSLTGMTPLAVNAYIQ